MKERLLKGLRIGLAVAFDAVVLVALLRIRMGAWYRGQRNPPVQGLDDVPEAWWSWGGPSDFLLFGPDAGNWAANARALMEGLPPDANRMPVYGYLTGFMAHWMPDVVFAGHLVNHLVSAGTVLLTYALGRMTSSRAAGLGAAFLVAVSSDLVDSQNLYGVDPTFNFVLLGLVVAAWGAIRGPWWMAIPTGLMMGATAASHYLGLLFPLPVALALLMAQGDWKRRVLPAVGALALGVLTFKLLMWPYEDYTLAHAFSVYSQGVMGATSPDQTQAGMDAAVQTVWSKLANAPGLAIQKNLGPLRSGWLAWALLVPLFWLGLVGPGLPPGSRLQLKKVPWDWRVGVLFLALMAPLVLLEAARAPDRYRFYARPIVALCVMRGVAAVPGAIDLAIRHFAWDKWPREVLPIPLVVAFAWFALPSYQQAWSGAPPAEGVHERRVGLAVAEHFEGAGGVATSSQAIAFYAGREVCPRSFCPRPASPGLAQCRAIHLQWCEGQGDLPYVVDLKPNATAADQPNAEMDDWVAERFEPVAELREGQRVTRIYAVPRSALR